MGIFGRDKDVESPQPGEEFVEVNVMDSEDKRLGRLGIRVEKMEDFADTERILRSIRKGNVVFLKIKSLREKDMGELKRAVEKLKKIVQANNGDIAGVEQDWLIITPEFAVVERE
jgi:SepF-like predicted cell division protein (DUF552 family)